MREKPHNFRILIRLVVVSASLVTFASGQVPRNSEQFALVGGMIYTNPTDPPIRNGVILVNGEKIIGVGTRASVPIPRGTRVIDCSGLTITGGFWNSHVHFLQRKWTDAATLPAAELTRQLQSMLTQYGFTTVFDTWSAWENTRRIRDRIESGEIAGPRIRSTGEAVFPKSAAAIDAATQASWGTLGFM